MAISHKLLLVALACVALACAAVATPDLAVADAVSDCGQAQIKAAAAATKAVLLEATRACAAGSAQNPGPVDTAKLQAAADKVTAANQAARDKFGAANCYVQAGQDVGDFVGTAESFAAKLCRVPEN